MLRRCSLGRLRDGKVKTFKLPRDNARPYTLAIDPAATSGTLTSRLRRHAAGSPPAELTVGTRAAMPLRRGSQGAGDHLGRGPNRQYRPDHKSWTIQMLLSGSRRASTAEHRGLLKGAGSRIKIRQLLCLFPHWSKLRRDRGTAFVSHLRRFGAIRDGLRWRRMEASVRPPRHPCFWRCRCPGSIPVGILANAGDGKTATASPRRLRSLARSGPRPLAT